MSAKLPPPNKIAVASYPGREDAIELAEDIAGFLVERGLTAHHASLYDEILRSQVKDRAFDLLIALGGDGTMLRAGHLCAPYQVPILGINIGGLGFLIEVGRDEWQSKVERVLTGDYWLQKRMMLRAEQWRDNELLGSWNVLNEVAVTLGSLVRPVQLIASVDGLYLTTYVADGLIAATPTGSTAYALAAGGPILPPDLRNILLVAVAPHLSLDRAIILAEGSTVSITVGSGNKAVLSPDGQEPIN